MNRKLIGNPLKDMKSGGKKTYSQCCDEVLCFGVLVSSFKDDAIWAKKYHYHSVKIPVFRPFDKFYKTGRNTCFFVQNIQ